MSPDIGRKRTTYRLVIGCLANLPHRFKLLRSLIVGIWQLPLLAGRLPTQIHMRAIRKP